MNVSSVTLAVAIALGSPQVLQAGQAAVKQQQNKTAGNAGVSREPQPPPPPTKVAIDGPITVINQPDPNEKQREAEQQAQTVFENRVQVATLLFAAIAAVGAIAAYYANRREANAAEGQLRIATSPRIYIDGIRVSNFGPGLQPVFFLRIGNVGPAQAEDVRVSIGVTHGHGETKPVAEWNPIHVPANSFRDYYFPVGFLLPMEMSELESWNLKVEGMVTLETESKSYCFKYNHWNGPRPDGVPLFIPCDIDLRRNVSATFNGVSATGAVGGVKPNGADNSSDLGQRERQPHRENTGLSRK
jgi:hypothetical protein